MMVSCLPLTSFRAELHVDMGMDVLGSVVALSREISCRKGARTIF